MSLLFGALIVTVAAQSTPPASEKTDRFWEEDKVEERGPWNDYKPGQVVVPRMPTPGSGSTLVVRWSGAPNDNFTRSYRTNALCLTAARTIWNQQSEKIADEDAVMASRGMRRITPAMPTILCLP